MIKKGIVLALSVTILLYSSIPLIAQQDPQQSEDQKIDALKKKQLELKRQIREEPKRKNKPLEEELNRLRVGSVQPKTPDSTPQPVASQKETMIPASLTSSAMTPNAISNTTDPSPTNENHASANVAPPMTSTPAAPS